jgi:hypothetical protein
MVAQILLRHHCAIDFGVMAHLGRPLSVTHAEALTALAIDRVVIVLDEHHAVLDPRPNYLTALPFRAVWTMLADRLPCGSVGGLGRVGIALPRRQAGFDLVQGGVELGAGHAVPGLRRVPRGHRLHLVTLWIVGRSILKPDTHQLEPGASPDGGAMFTLLESSRTYSRRSSAGTPNVSPSASVMRVSVYISRPASRAALAPRPASASPAVCRPFLVW